MNGQWLSLHSSLHRTAALRTNCVKLTEARPICAMADLPQHHETNSIESLACIHTHVQQRAIRRTLAIHTHAVTKMYLMKSGFQKYMVYRGQCALSLPELSFLLLILVVPDLVCSAVCLTLHTQNLCIVTRMMIVGRTVEHLKKELQQKGDIGLVAEVVCIVMYDVVVECAFITIQSDLIRAFV